MVPSTQPSTYSICASVHVGCWECFPLLSIYDPILQCFSTHSEINEVQSVEIKPYTSFTDIHYTLLLTI